MLIIDRLEGDCAVCVDSDGREELIPMALLPGAAEGDVVIPGDAGEYRIDHERTNQRRAAMARRLARLFARSSDE